jgi:non-ribosomal peptide synthetase component F
MNLTRAFGDVVKQQPDKVAVFWGDVEFTYRQLRIFKSQDIIRINALIA